MTKAQYAPRNAALDMIRGAAVIGIVPLNARWLLYPSAAYIDPTLYLDGSAAAALRWVVPELLLDHTTLFLLTYAMGAALAEAHRTVPPGLWRRHVAARAAALGGIGTVNMAVWEGDILLPYAVATAAAWPLLTARTGPGAWAPTAGALLAFTIAARAATAAFVEPGMPPAESLPWTHHVGPPAESLAGRAEAAREVLTRPFFFAALLPLMIGGMLTGAAHAASGYHRPGGAAVLWAAAAGLALTGGSVGLAAAAGMTPASFALGEEITYAGGLLLASAAICAVHRHADRLAGTAAGRSLAGCGRLTLTLYLGQVGGLAFIAQSWGMGLHGALTGETAALTALAAAGATAAAGRAFGNRRRRGPAERLVRLIAGPQGGRRATRNP